MTFTTKIMNNICVMFFVAFCVSCTHPTEQNFNTQMSSLYGQHIDVMIPKWGPPESKYTYQDGRMAYKWHQTAEDTFIDPSFYPGTGINEFGYWPSASQRMMSYGGAYGGGYSYGYPYGYGGYSGYGRSFMVNRPMTLVHHCTLTITTDNKGLIMSHQAVGDNCVAF